MTCRTFIPVIIYTRHFIFISIVLGRTPTMSMSGKYSHWSSYIPATTESAKIDFLKFISSSLSLKIHSSLLHCHFNIIIGKMQ